MASRVIPPLLVIDCWPVMEWLKGRQPASERFDEIVSFARDGFTTFAMCRLNFGEAVYTIRKAPDLLNRATALSVFQSLPSQLHPVEDSLVDEAVELKSSYPIAYMDAFAAAFAIRFGVPLVTGDHEFVRLEQDGLVELLWLGA